VSNNIGSLVVSGALIPSLWLISFLNMIALFIGFWAFCWCCRAGVLCRTLSEPFLISGRTTLRTKSFSGRLWFRGGPPGLLSGIVGGIWETEGPARGREFVVWANSERERLVRGAKRASRQFALAATCKKERPAPGRIWMAPG
jgi:hypothetical protein